MKLRATVQIEEDYKGQSKQPFWQNLKYGDILYIEMDILQRDMFLIYKNNQIDAYRIAAGNFNQVIHSLKHTTLQA